VGLLASKEVSVGLVGCGRNAFTIHAPNWLRVPHAKLTACCDSIPTVALSAAQRFGASHAYEDLGTMIARENLDVVDICSPPGLHESHTVQAFEGGCNVIVEKLISLRLRGADNMIRASQRAGRHLFVVHNNLFNAGIKKARSWVDAGEIGRITNLEIDYLNTSRTMDGWLLKSEHWIHRLPGGITTEALPHPIYLSKSLVAGLNVLDIFPRKLSGLSWVTWDDVRILLNAGDSQVSIHLSYVFPRSVRTITLVGEKAVVFVDLETGLAELLGSRSDSPLGLGTDYLSRSAQMLGRVGAKCMERLVRGFSVSGHYTLFLNAVDCLLKGSDPLVSLEDARDVVRLCEDIYSRYDVDKSDVT
jgi:predicted dehydrogenase